MTEREFKAGVTVRRIGKNHWSDEHPIGTVEKIKQMDEYGGGFHVSSGRYWSTEYAEIVDTKSELEVAIKECEDNLEQLRDQLRAIAQPKVGDVFRRKTSHQLFRIEFIMGNRCAYSKAYLHDTTVFSLEGVTLLSVFANERDYERVS